MGEKVNKIKNKEKKGAFKLLKIVLIIYIVILIFWLLINNYLKDDKTIYEKIGSMYPYSATTKDALNVKLHAILPFRDFLKNNEIESAYDMLTAEYKEYMPYDEFFKLFEDIDLDTFDLKRLDIKADGTYIATVMYERNGEKEESQYLLYMHKNNPNLITMSLDKFIYTFRDLKFNIDNTEVKIDECNVFTDNIYLKTTIKNTSSNEEITFTNIGLGYGEGINKNQDNEFTLKPGESKEIEMLYDTEFFIPNNIKIKRILDDDTLRTYTLYFKDAK